MKKQDISVESLVDNPFGPTATPTYRITVDASKANWRYGGSVEGGT